ncbi:hypothetical protein ACJX0J_019375, partial [Zea mays]
EGSRKRMNFSCNIGSMHNIKEITCHYASWVSNIDRFKVHIFIDPHVATTLIWPH